MGSWVVSSLVHVAGIERYFTMASTFKALVVSFLKAADTLPKLAAELRDHFEDPTNRAFVRSEVNPIIAEYYGVTMVAKERGEGLTFPKTVAGDSAANRASELVSMIVGKTSGHTPTPVKVTKAQISAAKEFLALFPSKAAALAAIKAVKV